jgi:hypothetical protein
MTEREKSNDDLKTLDPKDAQAILTTGDGDARGEAGPEGRPAIGGGVKDDMEGGTTGAASMTGGDSRQASTGASDDEIARRDDPGRDEAAPGGRSSPADGDMAPAEMPDSGSPSGQGSGAAGAGGQGSLGAATYNDSGNVTGPDSPAGEAAARDSDGGGQGDDLADRLGGGEGRGTGMSGAGAVTGDMRADRSEADDERPVAEGIGDDPGGPGGMGGVRARPAGSGRPPGGNAPPR